MWYTSKEMKGCFFGVFLFFLGISHAQQVICPARDSLAFEDKMIAIAKIEAADMGTTLTAVGKTFLGTAYVAKTLEIGETESIVVNLHGLDCTTYVENVLAFSHMIKTTSTDLKSFVRLLERIRYKDGKLQGYASRLHYFSEWIANNERKGLVRDITSELGGEEISKRIDFMSTHRELYPFLSEEENFKKIRASEQYLNGQPICILPQQKIAASEQLIRTGDIIALTTSIKGLDITHTGIATREKDGRIHLLHASSSGQVEVSKLPLTDYLKKIKSNTGIMVARPVF